MTTSTDDKGREYDERPWGSFTVLDEEMFDHKVKRIVVAPGKRLSYQQHAKRAEHWFVVSGHATVILDTMEYELDPGDSIDIEIGQAHRCENRGSVPIVLVEVQHGSYFGEDDIVRLEDDFGRAN
jgi:hypothetical protein